MIVRVLQIDMTVPECIPARPRKEMQRRFMGRQKGLRQERLRRCSSESVHALLTVPSAKHAHARQAAGSRTLVTLGKINAASRVRWTLLTPHNGVALRKLSPGAG